MIISIITICLNDKDALIRTRKSVETQVSHNYEHIIIDGDSNDGTDEYLKGLSGSVKWISEPDKGISDAFNKGIGIATGELILCLNAGDELYDENVIGSVCADWEENPVDVLSYKVEMPSGQIMWCRDEEFWTKGLHAHQGVFVTREAYKLLGGYNICLKSRMDYDLFLRMAGLNLSHRLIDKVVARFDTNGISQYDRRLAVIEGIGLKLIYEHALSIDDLNEIEKYMHKREPGSQQSYVDDKDKKYRLIYNWLDKSLSNKNISQYFKSNGIDKVSVYGAGQLGAFVIKELRQNNIIIVDLLDAVERKSIGEMTSVGIRGMNRDVDAVVVTVVDGCEEIVKEIHEISDVNVISLKDIVAAI